MIVDRRSRRAFAPLLAVEYLLDAERERSGASAVGLFSHGEPWVMSAPSGGERNALTGLVRDAARGERDLYVHPIRVGQRQMVLASIDARVRSSRRVEASIARILAG